MSKITLQKNITGDRCGEKGCGSADPPYVCCGCKSKFYCGEKCQWKDWDNHRKQCSIGASVRKFKLLDQTRVGREDGKLVEEREYLETLLEAVSTSDGTPKAAETGEELADMTPMFREEEGEFYLDLMEESTFNALWKSRPRAVRMNDLKTCLLLKRSDLAPKNAGEWFSLPVKVYFVRSDRLRDGKMEYAVTKCGTLAKEKTEYKKDVAELKRLLEKSINRGEEFTDEESSTCWAFYFAMGSEDFEGFEKIIAFHRKEMKDGAVEKALDAVLKEELRENFADMRTYFYEIISVIIGQDILGNNLPPQREEDEDSSEDEEDDDEEYDEEDDDDDESSEDSE